MEVESCDSLYWNSQRHAVTCQKSLGNWQTVWRLFDQWNSDDTLNEILQRLQVAFDDIGEIDNDL